MNFDQQTPEYTTEETRSAPDLSDSYREGRKIKNTTSICPHCPELEDRKARENQIYQYRELVERIARKFTGRGIPYEDLVQVGYLGLIKAIDRFDPSNGAKLTTFATHHIVGEIKHHIRDNGWYLKVSRRLKDFRPEAMRAIDSLAISLKRSPTFAEIAKMLRISEEEVIEIIELGNAFAPLSLNEPIERGGDCGMSLLDSLGDKGFEDVLIDKIMLDGAKKILARREQTIIALRYRYGLSQFEIAQNLGISQVHVSRLLKYSHAKMKEFLTPNANFNS